MCHHMSLLYSAVNNIPKRPYIYPIIRLKLWIRGAITYNSEGSGEASEIRRVFRRILNLPHVTKSDLNFFTISPLELNNPPLMKCGTSLLTIIWTYLNFNCCTVESTHETDVLLELQAKKHGSRLPPSIVEQVELNFWNTFLYSEQSRQLNAHSNLFCFRFNTRRLSKTIKTDNYIQMFMRRLRIRKVQNVLRKLRNRARLDLYSISPCYRVHCFEIPYSHISQLRKFQSTFGDVPDPFLKGHGASNWNQINSMWRYLSILVCSSNGSSEIRHSQIGWKEISSNLRDINTFPQLP